MEVEIHLSKAFALWGKIIYNNINFKERRADMKIFLIILFILALIVTAILILPVDIIIKSGEKGELLLRYKFLFKLYGENPDPNNPIIKAVKKTTGIEKLEAKEIKKKLKESSYVPTAVETISILKGLLGELGHMLKHFSARLFKIEVKCATSDAADAAINYGQYCALVYPLSAGLGVFIKIPKRARKIKIGFASELDEDKIEYEIIIRVKVMRVLAAFFRIAYKEAMRNLENGEPPKKAPSKRKKPSGKA